MQGLTHREAVSVASNMNTESEERLSAALHHFTKLAFLLSSYGWTTAGSRYIQIANMLVSAISKENAQ